MRPPSTRVHDDADALATAVARALLTRLAELQADGTEPQVGLTGGTIARRIHREAARLSPEHAVDWARVVLWWGDERFVAADADERNAQQARADLIDVVGVPADRVHEVPSSDDAPSAQAAAEAYSAAITLHGAGAFDLLMLGVGPDGHVASLFPGFPQLDIDDAIAVAVADSPKPPPERISLTYGALNHSRAVWFVVSGQEKADAVAAALSGADRHQTPAAGVTGEDETVWWLDAAAASRLP